MLMKAINAMNVTRLLAGLVILAFYAPAQAAPPVCPTPGQGYEISGCFVDEGGDEFPAGGTVDVYDLAFGQSLTDTFTMGTFLVDAFTVAPPSTPPASCGACGAVDFCVVATFNDLPAGTPTPQTFCADGNLTVNNGGFDLRGLTGGNPAVVTVPIPTYSVGGMVAGLAGTGLVLQNNGGDDLAIAANGAFQFSQPIADGSNYNVTVSSQPGSPAQECTVSNGSGMVTGANITTVTVSCETLDADLAIAKSDGGVANVVPGGTLDYTLTVTNNGPLDSTGGMVTDVLPAGLGFVSSASGCTEAGGTVSCAFGAVPASGSTVLTFVAEVDAAQTTDVSNTATVSGNEPDDSAANDSSTIVTPLALMLNVGGAVNGLEGTGLTLQNNGGDDLAIAADGTFQFPQALVDGSAYAVTVSAQPASPAQECTVTNGAGNLAGVDVTNVSVSCETLVADLAIEKSVGGVASVAPGATLNYTLTVTNNGPLDSTGGMVTDVLPAGLGFVSSASGCTEAGGTVSCAFGAIPAAGSTVLAFVAEVDAAQTTDVSNTATVAGNEPDDVAGNDSSTVVTVLDIPVPTVAMSFTPDTIPEGDTSTLTISIDNSAGTIAADSLDVSNSLPAGMVLADPANAATSCVAGTLTAVAGTAVLSYTGGSVAAGSSCEIQADVTSDVIGAALNTSGDLTSSLGNSGPASATLTVEALPARRQFTGLLPSGDTGRVSFTSSDPGCTFLADPVFMPVSSVSPAPPADLVFVDGVVSFEIERCAPGATVTVTVDYARPVDPDAQFWKAGSPWFALPSTVLGNTLSYEIVDGGSGDDDGAANGSIVDPGGAAYPVAPAPPVPPGPAAVAIPTLNWLALIAMALIFSLVGLSRLARP